MKRLSAYEIHQKQSVYQEQNFPLSLNKRKKLLEQLQRVIEDYSEEIMKALHSDLHKSETESDIAEINFVLSDIKFALKNLDDWAADQKKDHPLYLQPGSSLVKSEPLGKVLIISPWNYPFQLLLSPAISAIAAGNSVCLKASEISQATSQCVYDMISNNFEPEEIAIIEGDAQVSTQLLDLSWDHIFYTGNEYVGKIVMEKAAKHLTPVTLELGGKSPLLVFDCKNLDVAAKRIVWAKFYNAGQTCVAPDYLLVDKATKEKIIPLLIKHIKTFYSENPKESPDYGRIVSDKHFTRLRGLINQDNIVHGGEMQEQVRYIEPCLLEANENSPIMQEEIFGPILPILCVDDFKEAVTFVKKRPKPLAAYLFSTNSKLIDQFNNKVSAGGIGINEAIVHLANHHLPFGGVGVSGMGRYHGHYGFQCFSHEKAIMKRSFSLDLDLKYPPYKGKLKKLKSILGLLGE